jgi:hypothetical protein
MAPNSHLFADRKVPSFTKKGVADWPRKKVKKHFNPCIIPLLTEKGSAMS